MKDNKIPCSLDKLNMHDIQEENSDTNAFNLFIFKCRMNFFFFLTALKIKQVVQNVVECIRPFWPNNI